MENNTLQPNPTNVDAKAKSVWLRTIDQNKTKTERNTRNWKQLSAITLRRRFVVSDEWISLVFFFVVSKVSESEQFFFCLCLESLLFKIYVLSRFIKEKNEKFPKKSVGWSWMRSGVDFLLHPYDYEEWKKRCLVIDFVVFCVVRVKEKKETKGITISWEEQDK